MNVTPLEMLNHIRTASSTLDYMDESQLLAKLMKPWDVKENPATKFARDDKLEKQLVKIGYSDQQKPRLAFALSAIKATGDYDPLIREWDAKPATARTFANFGPFFINEYSHFCFISDPS
jgi:hypothetical protein